MKEVEKRVLELFGADVPVVFCAHEGKVDETVVNTIPRLQKETVLHRTNETRFKKGEDLGDGSSGHREAHSVWDATLASAVKTRKQRI